MGAWGGIQLKLGGVDKMFLRSARYQKSIECALLEVKKETHRLDGDFLDFWGLLSGEPCKDLLGQFQCAAALGVSREQR